MKHDSSFETAHRATALILTESTVVDICEMLSADTININDTSVTFTKVLPHADRLTWSGELGDWLVSDGCGWAVLPNPRPASDFRVA